MKKSLLNILVEALADEAPEEKAPEDTGDAEAKLASGNNIITKPDDIMDKFKILRLVLWELLTGEGSSSQKNHDINDLVGDIAIVSYKPTTFDIKFKNGNSMVLKYDPTPQQMDPAKKKLFKPKDYFQLTISGKRYDLMKRSDFTQALNYIGQALKSKPVGTNNNSGAEGEAEYKPKQLGKDEPDETPKNEPKGK